MFIGIWLPEIACNFNIKATNTTVLNTKFRLDEKLRVKISDFGLCRDVYENGVYVRSAQTAIPIRWMPPNYEMEYTFKSDVVRV